MEDYVKLQEELKEKEQLIASLESQVLGLEEELEEIKKENNEAKDTKKDGKTYSTDMRMLIHDSIVSQVSHSEYPFFDSEAQ